MVFCCWLVVLEFFVCSFLGGVLVCCLGLFLFVYLFNRLKGVGIAAASVTISSAQYAFLLNTAFSVIANIAQNVPEQCQADPSGYS